MKALLARYALPVAVAVLVVVWLFFVATILFDLDAPQGVTVAMMIAGLAAGIVAFVWVSRHGRSV